MKNAKRLRILISFILFNAAIFLSFSAEAGWFLEPYVGFGKLQVAIYDQQYNDYDEKDISDGFMLGIKSGYAFDKRVFVGFDYQTSGPFVFGRVLNSPNQTAVKMNNGSEWNQRILGAGLGFDYEIIRFWAGYYFWDEIDDTANQNKYNGTAYKVGFGIKVAKEIHTNLDLIFDSITKQETPTSSGSYDKYRVQSAFVSISIPIELK